jgi:hypothetical protein
LEGVVKLGVKVAPHAGPLPLHEGPPLILTTFMRGCVKLKGEFTLTAAANGDTTIKTARKMIPTKDAHVLTGRRVDMPLRDMM